MQRVMSNGDSGAPVPEPTTGPPQVDRPRRWDRSRSAIVLAGLLVTAAVLVGLHVADYPQVSPIDELQHIDYLYKARDLEGVGRGDLFGHEAMDEEACRGLDAEFVPPACGVTPYNPRAFQEGGYNTAYVHPPVYYTVTAWIGSAISAVLQTETLVTGGRLVGVLWLGAALAVLWRLMGDLGVRDGTRAGVLLLTMCSPLVLFQASTISPDATALLAGALCLWAVMRYDRGTIPWWVPALAAALAVSLKSTNIIGVGAAVLYLAIRHLQRRAGVAERSSARRPDWLVVVAMGAAVALVSLGFLVLSSSLASIDARKIPMLARMRAPTFPLDGLVSNVRITPLQIESLSVFAWGPLTVIASLVGLGLAIGSIVSIAMSEPGDSVRAVAGAGLVSVLIAGPMFVLVNYLLSEIYTGIPARYSLAAAPAMIVATAVALDRLSVRWLLPFAGVIAVGLTAFRLLS